MITAFFLWGCTPTSAPTESVTNTADNVLNGLLDVSSSTTPGNAGYNSTGVDAFTRSNYACLKIEMAQGDGEHIRALATLLAVPLEKHDLFFSLVQENFSSLYPTPQTPPGIMLTRLYQTMDSADLFYP